MKKIFFILTAVILLLGLNIAHARFGGGHSSSSSHSSSSHSYSSGSYSGSSFSWGSSSGSSYHSSSSTNNGDDDGSFVIGLIIFIAMLAIIFAIIWYIGSQQQQIVISQNDTYFDEQQLISFKQHDDNFSRILFLDFVHLLYVKYYSYYGKKEFKYLTPYLESAVTHDKTLDLLINNQVITISEIVINAINLVSMESTVVDDKIVLEIAANFTIHPAFHTQESGKQYTRYERSERWILHREKGLLSLPPEKMQALSCPSCGAAAHFTDTGECDSCHTTIQKGQMQWYVRNRTVLEQNVLNTGDLIAYAEEQGTNLASLTSKNLMQEIAAFEQQRALVWSDYWQTFKQQIVQNYFMELNAAWTNHDLGKVRHLISDRLYDANSFWMSMYKQNGWNNRLDDLIIQDIQIIKIELDSYYESITVRIFASCFDYTEDQQHKILGGSKQKRRNYSEYWTFARRAGVEKSESSFSLNSCPQCGAAADKMGQSAICEYCGSKISTGEFSWILFLITQDENYQG